MAGVKKHVRKQVYDSDLLRHDKQATELYAQWNDKLEADGLRAFDNDYRGYSPYASKKQQQATDEVGSARLEYYDILRDYCRYSGYQLKMMINMSKREQAHFKQMLVLFANGQSMPEAYKIVKANISGKIFTAVYFYKRFQEAKDEYLSQFQMFSEYMQYRKYELGTALSFPNWLTKQAKQ